MFQSCWSSFFCKENNRIFKLSLVLFSERRTSDREVFDRIISVVDDDDSDHSDIGELNDSDAATTESADHKDRAITPVKDRLHDTKADEESDKPDSDDKDSKHDTKTAPAINNNNNNNNNTIKTGSDSNPTQPTPRPKIWSVMDVLGNKDIASTTKSSTQTSAPASVCSRPTNGPAFLNAHQATPNFRPGQYPMGFNGYPFSFCHTTLSYPYTLNAGTAAKTELSMSHVAAIRASEQAFKDGLVEKAARMQTGLFSPARELDGMRVRSKIVL